MLVFTVFLGDKRAREVVDSDYSCEEYMLEKDRSISSSLTKKQKSMYLNEYIFNTQLTLRLRVQCLQSKTIVFCYVQVNFEY